MDLIILVLVIALIGCAVWWITNNIPMAPMFKTLIYIVVFIVLLLWLLRKFGSSIPNVM